MIAILAAGRASRFGAPKLLADCAGKPLGRWALDAALACGERVVWVASAEMAAIAAGDCTVILNERPERGLGSSLALAAGAAIASDAPRLLVLLADMPLVGRDLIASMLAAPAPAACRHTDGAPGVPALFAPRHYPDLAAADGDAGAGRLLRRLDDVTLIDCEPHRLIDVDTAAELARVAELLSGAAEPPADPS